MKKEYRVIRFYNNFFANDGFKLQKKCKFLFWTFWSTIQVDNLGLHGDDWCNHYKCVMIDS